MSNIIKPSSQEGNMDSNRNEQINQDYQSSLDEKYARILFQDPYYKSIIDTEEFRRLKGISFLGAIDKTHNSPSKKSNRLDHSIDVAKLALHISNARGYSNEIEKLLVSSALVHDIGHAPLSHSMESSFYKEFQLNHHIASENIIDGKNNNKLSIILKKNLDISQLKDLINQNSFEEFSDVFSSPINVDTIDGIHRSLRYLGVSSNTFFNVYDVADAAFLKEQLSRTKQLDKFWKCKQYVYDNIITSGVGALADYFSKEVFYDKLPRINPSYFYKREESFFNNQNPIFKGLISKLSSVVVVLDKKNIEKRSHGIIEKNFTILKRSYKVNNDVSLPSDLKSLKKRYYVEKSEEPLRLHFYLDNKESKSKQMKLF
ncbi:HD domain-containing protein [Pseudoalteromonas piscicida]|uniref:HD domain-containing protein n=1 Tax=Pseudoalteromonas piscicida TaxID=43662 RepID=UPI0030B63671